MKASLLYIFLPGFVSISLHADNLKIPVGQQNQGSSIPVPERGESMETVAAAFGEPESKTGPVGNPPITTWAYPEFRVYFEYRHVIHSVIPFKPEYPEALE